MTDVHVPDTEAYVWINSAERTKDSPTRVIFADKFYRCSVTGKSEVIVECLNKDVFGFESWVIVERNHYGNSHMANVILRMRDKARGVGSEPLHNEEETHR